MKLLEERTEASKNEMARMEALEELQELNKREVKVNYDQMLDKYNKLREQELLQQEKEDEEFIKRLFGKDGDGSSVKRIEEDSSSDEDSSSKARSKVKTVPPAKATDLLTRESGKATSLGKSSAIPKKRTRADLGIVVKKKK